MNGNLGSSDHYSGWGELTPRNWVTADTRPMQGGCHDVYTDGEKESLRKFIRGLLKLTIKICTVSDEWIPAFGAEQKFL